MKPKRQKVYTKVEYFTLSGKKLSSVWYEAQVEPVFDKNGKLVKVVVFKSRPIKGSPFGEE
jgi:hypothetical protein